jgi:hypothetical protein
MHALRMALRNIAITSFAGFPVGPAFQLSSPALYFPRPERRALQPFSVSSYPLRPAASQSYIVTLNKALLSASDIYRKAEHNSTIDRQHETRKNPKFSTAAQA